MVSFHSKIASEQTWLEENSTLLKVSIMSTVFRRSYNQKGYRLGSTIFKYVLPFLRQGLATVGKRALNVGVNALSDVAENNTSVKDAFKNQLHQEYRSLKKRINRPRSSTSVSVPKTTTKKEVDHELKKNQVLERLHCNNVFIHWQQ